MPNFNGQRAQLLRSRCTIWPGVFIICPKEENYWMMLVELEEISSPYEINVVLSEDTSFSLREKARNEGYPL